MTFPDVGLLDAPLCPFLGRVDDERTSFTFPHHQHRCYAVRRNARPDYAYQAAYCLGAYGECPRYLKASADPKHAGRMRAAAEAARARPAAFRRGPDEPARSAVLPADASPVVARPPEPVPAGRPVEVPHVAVAEAGRNDAAREPATALPPVALVDLGILAPAAPGNGHAPGTAEPAGGAALAREAGSVDAGRVPGGDAAARPEAFMPPAFRLEQPSRATRAIGILVRLVVLVLAMIAIAVAVALISPGAAGGHAAGWPAEWPARYAEVPANAIRDGWAPGGPLRSIDVRLAVVIPYGHAANPT